MDRKTDRFDLVEWARKTRNWNAKIASIAMTLDKERARRVDLSGSIIVRGKPETTVNLFVKYGKVILKNGKEIKVLSADLADLVAVSVTGDVLDTSEPRLSVL